MSDPECQLLRKTAISVVWFPLLFTGCGQGDAAARTPHQSKAVSGAVTADESAAASLPVVLETGNWEDVQAHVAESAGKIVVVDLWSTSCIPCIKELPRLGQLQRDRSENVVCISLSVDYIGLKSRPAESYRERVQKTLERCDVRGRNFLCTTDSDMVFRKLDLPSIPAVYVYGADGQLVQRFDASSLKEGSSQEEPFSYNADILPLVNQLIADLD